MGVFCFRLAKADDRWPTYAYAHAPNHGILAASGVRYDRLDRQERRGGGIWESGAPRRHWAEEDRGGKKKVPGKVKLQVTLTGLVITPRSHERAAANIPRLELRCWKKVKKHNRDRTKILLSWCYSGEALGRSQQRLVVYRQSLANNVAVLGGALL
ncbi:hypothetical protein LZ30DRAFT_773150 [Colletotrichum cereale]|nr:hypothetical protein LZ30DRAFT_773150 [Colletotrichum cereale]